MKYIRTKDSVYEIAEEINYDGELFYYVKTTPPRKAFEECEILKQADTIEELCDGFYIDDGSGDFKKENIFETILEFENVYHKKRISDTYAIGYGFIKTFKGLIYVAKMNEKGELELI